MICVLVLMSVAPLPPIVRAENGIQRGFKPRLAKGGGEIRVKSACTHALGNSRSPYFFDLILICLVW